MTSLYNEIKEAIQRQCDGTYSSDPRDWDFNGSVVDLLIDIERVLKSRDID
jgi:hypothetical protein